MADEAAVADNTAQAETTSWFSEENRKLVESKGWKTGDDALKSYSELEKDYSKKVKIPDEKDPPEERERLLRKVYEKLGCPKTPDDYQIQVSDDFSPLRNESLEKRILAKAHAQGASQSLVNTLVNEYYQGMADDMAKGKEEGMETLRSELGDNYEKSLKIAQDFVLKHCSPEFQAVLESTGLGNHPVFVKEFMNLGKKTINDSLIKGNTTPELDKDYKPSHPNSPGMYATGEDEDSRKARAYFTARGHKY